MGYEYKLSSGDSVYGWTAATNWLLANKDGTATELPRNRVFTHQHAVDCLPYEEREQYG